MYNFDLILKVEQFLMLSEFENNINAELPPDISAKRSDFHHTVDDAI